jgi:transcriptional regulator with XRE-family HTH domain
MKIYWNKEEGTKNIIGNKIKALRKEAGLTQKQLAEKLQLQGHEFSDLTILRIEQGTRFVPDYEVVILADFFKVTTDELLK